MNIMNFFNAIKRKLKQCAYIMRGIFILVLICCFSQRDRRLFSEIYFKSNRYKIPPSFKHRIYCIEKMALSVLLFRRSVSLTEYIERGLEKLKGRWTNDKVEKYQRQVRECSVLAWLVFLGILLFYFCPIHQSWIARLLAVSVIIIIWGSINYPLCIIFIDINKPTWKPQSFTRLIILLFINYLQTVTGFAYLYLNNATVIFSKCGNVITCPCDALYFSLVTITTLGYGDMEPFDTAAKCLVMSEILIGLGFLTLVVATIVNLFSRKSKDSSP